MSLQQNNKKKSLSPPESLRGGGHFCCPPLNCSEGRHTPPVPPCIRSCMYIFGLRVGVKSRKDRRDAVVSLCENCTNSMNTASFSM